MINPKDFGIQGLSEQEVLAARKRHGKNTLDYKKQHKFIDALKDILQEPMVLLLSVASGIYFLTGNIGDGIFLASAIVLVASISFYQESKSKNALEKLNSITQPKAKVIRDGEIKEIQTHDLVIGDCIMVEEGNIIPADGVIIHSNDFSVNESLLTGESMAVFKDVQSEKNQCYTGTTVASGLAIATVTAIGNATALGKIGKSLENIQNEKTPLEIQIASFVKKMSIVGGITFLLVWGINYYNTQNILDSLLKALTLAMSILPEEIPVAFTTFMALGSWRLMKLGIVVKQIKTVESLGSATVICIDKTGTITQNKMSLVKLYLFKTDETVSIHEKPNALEQELIDTAMWSSEPIPFDPMEVSLHEAYASTTNSDERQAFRLIHEYPLGGKPPMMTHLFENQQGERIIAAKGAPEAFLPISNLKEVEKAKIQKAITVLGDQGYRLLGVGIAKFKGTDYPETQQEFLFDFLGLVAFYDPPKKNISTVLKEFDRAGITVKLITGDTATTASAIAKEVHFIGYEKGMTGAELMQLDDKQLQEKVKHIQVFSRMFPDAKLRIINALKANSEVVAMIGDGVNDGPALKAAYFGIAMGTKGTEIAKEAASLILVDDDLSKMIDSIAMGRKIYSNLKKAIQYIISIHIPIILTVFIPLALGWAFPNIFSPTHVILLELIMGPTCSIIYENEPLEKNTMLQKPRLLTDTFFKMKELLTSIIQGLAITVGTLAIYQYGILADYSEDTTRTMVFLVLIIANIGLTLVNRSFYYSILTTLKYKNNLVPLIIGITVVITAALLFIPPFTRFFQFSTLTLSQVLGAILIGLISVLWYELVKWNQRNKNNPML
ncbi:cation-translocating P-type ATPase [Cellulophaga sp. HaHa_2_95]|uniref:cation-translocating P-type ATPase n=1 Tax=Cellulophaga sp. HaHa_2_95 TaxID=2745558 RepID=UPI001C4E650D|nr:cation-translocating P-type ATPase [Cellulophaga sp. HaHa_2_95]QXP55322.1 cation-translocating P-type ATPase [Cellulophaga sp. HaHa_2_95]